MAAVWKAVIRYGNQPVYELFPPLFAFFSTITCGATPSRLREGQVRAEVETCLHRLHSGGEQSLGEKGSKTTSKATENDTNDSRTLWYYI